MHWIRTSPRKVSFQFLEQYQAIRIAFILYKTGRFIGQYSVEVFTVKERLHYETKRRQTTINADPYNTNRQRPAEECKNYENQRR